MAKISNELLQGIHGKLGEFVFRRVNGVSFLCKRPVFRKRKLTKMETTIRKKFAFMVQFLKPLMPLIRGIHKQSAGGKSGFNLVFSYNYHKILTGEYARFQINYPRIILSRGSLTLPEWMVSASIIPGTISFVWTCSHFFREHIFVFFAVYCEELKSWKFDVDNATMTDNLYNMDLKDFSGKTVHSYIGFVSADGKKISNSCYSGMVNIL